MLLADILHQVLSSRGRWQPSETFREKNANIDKRFEEKLKRLCWGVDYRADKADKVLRCKITSMALPPGNDTVCINISPSRPKKTKNKNRIIKKQ